MTDGKKIVINNVNRYALNNELVVDCQHMSKPYNIDQIMSKDWNVAQGELCGALERIGGLDKPGALNRAETEFLAAFNSWGEAKAEGLGGWLLNHQDQPETLERACAALRAIGAHRRAAVLWKVAGLFPASPPSADPAAYAEVVGDESHDEFLEEVEAEMDDLERGEDVGELLHRYVTLHVQDFR